MARLTPVLLLTISNIFMTFAWYGHLRHTHSALPVVILVSWGIAFFEYVFQVPANRIGFLQGWTGYELKVVQEVITLVVFTVFATFYLKEKAGWNNIAAFGCILLAVWLTFGFGGKQGRGEEQKIRNPNLEIRGKSEIKNSKLDH